MAGSPMTDQAHEAVGIATDPGRGADRVAWLVVGCWVLATIGATWAFEYVPVLGASASVPVSFELSDPQALERWLRDRVASSGAPPLMAQATVVSLSRDDCSCEPSAEAHLQRLTAAYAQRGVRFMSAAPAELGAARTRHPLVAPAALVFDRRGRLVYYGPLADSAFCGSDDGLLTSILDRTLDARTVPLVPTAARGCFCT